MLQVAALYVHTSGVYFDLPNVDPWDETRDARGYRGPHPVVAHPPCTRWCQLASVVQARYGYKIGDDGGCFAAALDSVRNYGGILEHPAYSKAWPAFGLERPPKGGGWAQSASDEWGCEVAQRAYGHPARKLTWLLYVGDIKPPELDWSRPTPIATVSWMTNHGGGDLPRVGKKEAAATTVVFRDLLLSLARMSAISKET